MIQMLYYGIWIVGAISSFLIPIVLLYKKSATSVAYVQSVISTRRRLIGFMLIVVAGLASSGTLVSFFGNSLRTGSAPPQAPSVASPTILVEPKTTPQVVINNFEGVAATLSLKTPTSGIECSQVRKRSDGIWDITGNIQVGGVTLAHVRGVGPRGFNIGGNDLASLLERKCGLSQPQPVTVNPEIPLAPGPSQPASGERP